MFGTLPVCTAATQAMLATATNYQDIWWAAASGESGWGVYLTHQGSTIFASWFSYDLDGSPLWLSVTASQNAAGVYSGTLYRTTGPAFGAPFDSSKVAYTPVGSATLTFGDGDDATFAYSVTIGSGRVAENRSVCRSFGIREKIFRISGRKPMSSIRSASSSTRTWRSSILAYELRR